jgi:hypothetical protein
MNAKTVLKKLVMMLSSNEVELTYAKLKDGTIVESETFDVGEALFVISEDGEKSPAPNGEHELSLRDSEGNETLLKVITEDGVIKERENVELADMETKEAEDIPASGPVDMPTEMSEETYETAPGDIPTTGDGIPADVDQGKLVGSDKDIAKMMEELSYRIEEMEKKMKMAEEKEEEKMMEDKKKEEEMEDEMEEDEEELPKLDGAPIEARVKKLSSVNTKKSTPGMSSQERVLARLYNKNN